MILMPDLFSFAFLRLRPELVLPACYAGGDGPAGAVAIQKSDILNEKSRYSDFGAIHSRDL